jgi:hypothetical protein
LVRRVKRGNNWHPATDQLRGTHVYGTYVNDPTSDTTFSKAFDINRVKEFLFATGDGTKWLVASRDSVMHGYYSNAQRDIIMSSSRSTPYKAKWYRRQGAKEDPWISIFDHGPSINAGDIVYGENNFGHAHAQKILPHRNGANVFVRYAGMFLFSLFVLYSPF